MSVASSQKNTTSACPPSSTPLSTSPNTRVVQDLERQLRDTKNDLYDAQTTIDNLRAELHVLKTTGKSANDHDGHPDLYVTSSDSLKARLALSKSSDTSPTSTPAVQTLNPFHDYEPLRNQIIRLSDGIFKAPPGWAIATKQVKRREAKLLQLINLPQPVRLPDRKFADKVLDIFREKVEKMIYIMNWPEFEANMDAMYRDSVDGIVPPTTRLSFVRFFFGLLGFTMIWSQDDRICRGHDRSYVGHEFIAVAYQMPLKTSQFHLDDVRAGLQVIFWLKLAHFLELAHVWSGSTIKIAQQLGLHQELEGLPSTMRDERRRVWWYVYAFDRYFAVVPSLITVFLLLKHMEKWSFTTQIQMFHFLLATNASI
jgi:Fungal specific transcription factor domain